jgi:hypothetical protein
MLARLPWIRTPEGEVVTFVSRVRTLARSVVTFVYLFVSKSPGYFWLFLLILLNRTFGLACFSAPASVDIVTYGFESSKDQVSWIVIQITSV